MIYKFKKYFITMLLSGSFSADIAEISICNINEVSSTKHHPKSPLSQTSKYNSQTTIYQNIFWGVIYLILVISNSPWCRTHIFNIHGVSLWVENKFFFRKFNLTFDIVRSFTSFNPKQILDCLEYLFTIAQQLTQTPFILFLIVFGVFIIIANLFNKSIKL